jgi:hypothetical protein
MLAQVKLFADLPVAVPAPAEIGVWLTVLAFLLVIVLTVKQILPARRQPPIEAEFLSREDHAAHEKKDAEEFNKLWVAINAVKDDNNRNKMEILQAGDDRARRIHERMDTVNAGVNQSMQEMPGRIITLLRDTGHIK